jgi:hypothetical protein
MTEDKTVYTRILTPSGVEAVLQGLPSLIKELAGDCILSVEYGVGCNIHNDLQYKPMEVGIFWLHRFLAESKEQRIFLPGQSDLSITTPNGGLTIIICHESDVHLSGLDAALVRKASQSDVIRLLLRT